MLATKAKAYWQLTRMDRPIGTLLLLWPTLWALVIAANGLPDLSVFVVFVLGVVLMRSAGCVINDFADRKVDGHVKRTKQRPLPSGAVSSKEAVVLFLVLAIVSFLLVLTMNTLTIQLSFVGVGLAFIYPFMKRFTHLPQLFWVWPSVGRSLWRGLHKPMNYRALCGLCLPSTHYGPSLMTLNMRWLIETMTLRLVLNRRRFCLAAKTS